MAVSKISVVVVDDHKLLRDMFIHIFSNSETIEVVGESGEFNKAIELIKTKRPDIVLLDINLPPSSGLDAVPLIRKFSPGTRIIAISMHSQPVYAKKMLKLGAMAYVTKNSPRDEIFKAIEEVMNDRRYICSEIQKNLTEQILINEDIQPSVNDLSMREMEIIRLIKNGQSSKEIGVNLNISTRTVEVHRHNILKKMKLKNTASLLNFINGSELNFS